MDNNNTRHSEPWLPEDSDSKKDKQDNRHSAWPPKGPERNGQNRNRKPNLPKSTGSLTVAY